MNEELKSAIQGLIRFAAKSELDDQTKEDLRIVTCYIEHGPLPEGDILPLKSTKKKTTKKA